MKKMLVVAFVAMFAFAACGKKKDAAAPTGGTEPAPAETAPTETPAEGTGTETPAEGAPAEGAEATP